MNDASALVASFVGSLEVSRPVTVAGLTMFAIHHSAPSSDYLTYSEASASNTITIAELDEHGQVGSLLVSNAGDRAVLLIEGEILLGMKQTRVLNVSVLVPPVTRLVVPVSCIEAGRWNHATQAAHRDKFHLSPTVRSVKSTGVAAARQRSGYRSDQGAVWDAVQARLERAEVSAPTHSYAELNSIREVDIERLVAHIEPAPGQSGVLAVVRGRPLCIDVFDSPSTLGKVWEGLIGSYAADSLGMTTPKPPTEAIAKTWLRAVGRAIAEASSGVGLGEIVAISGRGVTGLALVAGGVVLHLAAGATGPLAAFRPMFSSPDRRRR